METKLPDKDTILEIFNGIYFGLELEVCTNILGNKYFYNSTEEKFSPEEMAKEVPDLGRKGVYYANEEYRQRKAAKAYMRCMQHFYPDIEWLLHIDGNMKNQDYSRWVVMFDYSVECSRMGKCYIRNVETQCSDKLIYYPLEIATPKLQGMEGLTTFYLFYSGAFMNENVTYLVNTSQGLHVNLSHPKMDKKRFLNLWVYFEPILWQIVGKDRREDQFYCRSLYETHEKYLMAEAEDKCSSLRIGADRLEVRMYPGTVNYKQIISWTMFCMHLLVLSMLTDIGQASRSKLRNMTEKELLDDFFSSISDETLVKHFLSMYNHNKERKWPYYEYTGKTEKIYTIPSAFTIGMDRTRMLTANKKKSCPD